MSALAVMILACGESKRFAVTGDYDVPKQYLSFRVAPHEPRRQMWINATYGLKAPHGLILMNLIDHQHFQEGYEGTTTFGVASSRGQAHTLLMGLDRIRWMDYDELLVLNCDNGFAPGLLDRLVEHGREWQRPAALTFCVANEDLRWSFVDGHPLFGDAMEKRAFSGRGFQRALAGAYYFPQNSRVELERACREVALSPDYHDEPYVSKVLAHMSGTKVSVAMLRDDFYDWGTPEAFERFIGGDREHHSHS